MMKRITSFVLLLFFLAGNSHAGINIHYCGGELSSISLITKSKSCSTCGMKASANKCCKDVQKILKADDFSKVHANYSFQSLLIAIVPSYSTFNVKFQAIAFQFVSSFFGNPPKLKTPIFIRICSLVI
ncbi:MAG: HYC_CC_PP family protein [Cytophagales bacterium]